MIKVKQKHTLLGNLQEFTVKATEAKQLGVHNVCLTPQFEKYPGLNFDVKRIIITVKPAKTSNLKPNWTSSAFASMPAILNLKLGKQLQLDYSATDGDD